MPEQAVWEQRDDLDLTDEQARVLMLTHRGPWGGAQGAEDAHAGDQIAPFCAGPIAQNLLADDGVVWNSRRPTSNCPNLWSKLRARRARKKACPVR